MPSAEYMKQHGVEHADGLSLNMEQPRTEVGHRLTDIYGMSGYWESFFWEKDEGLIQEFNVLEARL